jgi:hypothetical protein
MRRWHVLRLLGLACLIGLAAGPAWAQDFPRQQQTVYTGKVFDGFGYTSTFYPRDVPAMYLIADVNNALDVRATQVYFWPLTGEYKADWDALNRPITGTLEITQGSVTLATLTPTEFVLVTQEGSTEPNALIAGTAASRALLAYRSAMTAYTTAMNAYLEQSQAYTEAAAQNLRRAQRGEPVQDLQVPVAPAQPQPAVSELYNGYLVKLPAGRYTMQVRANDGQVVPGTDRVLEVFGVDREGIGYALRAESRWNQPVVADRPESVLYWGPDTILYIEPFQEWEINELAYARLKTPQSPAAGSDRRVWVPVRPLTDGQIELFAGGQVVTSLPIKTYVVTQLPGSSLGYSISEQVAPLPKDLPTAQLSTLRAARLDLRQGPLPEKIRTRDASGGALPLSERQVRQLRPLDPAGTWIPLLLPPVVGSVIILGRRRRTANTLRR